MDSRGGAAVESGEGLPGLPRTAETLTSFKYLGRILTTGEANWLAVERNLRKASKRWTQMTRILGWERSDLRMSGLFFKAVVQAVLLFGSEMWVLTPRMERALGSFHNKIAGLITGRQPIQRGEGRWEYPPLT